MATETSRSRLNTDLARYLVAHLMAMIAEWTVLIGVLVDAYERGGSRTAGVASFASLMPYLLLSSAMARLVQRFPPAVVRTVGLGAACAGATLSAVAAAVEAPIALVVAGAVVFFTAVTSLRPIGSVVVPALVRTSRELTVANVRVGHCENAAILLGPLAATGLLAAGGPAMVLAGCAGLMAVAAALAATAIKVGPTPARPDVADGERRRGVVRAVTLPFREFAEVARRPGARSVLVVDGAQYLLVGSFDIILVVLAGEYLDLGGSGAGVLGSLFGVGSLLSNAVTGRLAGRARLAPTMLVMVAVVAAGCALFGASVSLVAACVVLPIAGFGRSLTSLLGRVLMQRSAPPSALPVLFGALETTSGLGLLLGSLMTQLLIAASGVEAALFAVSGSFVVVLALTARSLRRADEGADVPVVAMSLLRRLPVFEPLPTAALEAVARGAEECHLEPGDIVIRQGEPGDRYFAIAAGRFDVTVDDVVRRTLGRGDGFGEIALLSDTPRTATVTAASAGTLLAVERVPFLVAVTGHDASRTAAWSAVRTHHVVDDESDQADPGDQPSGGNPPH